MESIWRRQNTKLRSWENAFSCKIKLQDHWRHPKIWVWKVWTDKERANHKRRGREIKRIRVCVIRQQVGLHNSIQEGIRQKNWRKANPRRLLKRPNGPHLETPTIWPGRGHLTTDKIATGKVSRIVKRKATRRSKRKEEITGTSFQIQKPQEVETQRWVWWEGQEEKRLEGEEVG